MSDRFQIVIQADEQTIRERSHGASPIVCPITVRIGDAWFPHKDWDDFALTILEAWLQEAQHLDEGAVRKGKLRFMDGPYVIEVKAKSSGAWLLNGIRTDTGAVMAVGECDSDQIIATIVRARRELLRGVRASGLWTTAFDNLETVINRTFPAVPV